MTDFLSGFDPSLRRLGTNAPGWDGEVYIPLWKRCGSCQTQTSRSFCDEHRCSFIRANGERCRQVADPARGYAYCQRHGCGFRLTEFGSQPVIRCMNAATAPVGGDHYCVDHLEPGRLAFQQDMARIEYMKEHAEEYGDDDSASLVRAAYRAYPRPGLGYLGVNE